MCLNYLSRREYSYKELYDKLKRQGFVDDVIDNCLITLREKGYQSDQRFAEMLIRTRISQRYGGRKIAYELNQKGVKSQLFTPIIEQYNSQLLDNAQQLIIRKSCRYGIDAVFKQPSLKSRIVRFLLHKGYDYDTIHLALEVLQERCD